MKAPVRKNPVTLTQRDVRGRLHYEPWSGVFRWRAKPVRCGRDSQWNGRYAGKPAGNLNSLGYHSITIGTERYATHRLAWLYVYGTWPDSDIDHRDRDKGNNTIANLRLATEAQNLANQGLRRNNTSGYKNVWRHGKKWAAAFRADQAKRHLGVFDTPAEAAEAYRVASVAAMGEFAAHA
jgi:hypothetical protein